jgi:hypothetical protein
MANPQFGLWAKDDEMEEIDVFGSSPSAEEAYLSLFEEGAEGIDEIDTEAEAEEQLPAFSRGGARESGRTPPDLDRIMAEALAPRPFSPEEEKKKIALRAKKLVSNPPSFDEGPYRRPFTKNEAKEILFNARLFFQRVVHTSIVSRYEATDQDGRSTGPCQVIWFTAHDREFCLWLKFVEKRWAWKIVKAFVVSNFTGKRSEEA